MPLFGSQGPTAANNQIVGQLSLRRPVSIAVYNSYEDAQRAVDYLADNQFPVQNLAVVGTDLKSFERITGGLSWGKVMTSAAMSGIVWGAMAAFFMWMFMGNSSSSVLIGAVLVFMVANMLSSAIGYRMTGGRRDFTSTSKIIATHYEVLGESEVAGQARQMLSGGSHQKVREAQPANPPAETARQPGYVQSDAPQSQSPTTQASPGAAAPINPAAFPPPAWPAPGNPDDGSRA